jgi:hypothetical protein
MIKQPDLSSLIEDTAVSAPMQQEGTVAAPPCSTKVASTEEVESPMHRPVTASGGKGTSFTASPVRKRSKEEVVDSDLLLALQLQEEERQEAHRQEVDQAGNSSRNQSQPQDNPNPAAHTSHSVPTNTAVGNFAAPAGNAEGLPLSQEEMDQQYAMMLHYQEINAQQQQPAQEGGSRRTTPQNSRYEPQPSQPRNNQSVPQVQTGRGSKDNGGNCIIQ